jgi:hypothetical protein
LALPVEVLMKSAPSAMARLEACSIRPGSRNAPVSRIIFSTAPVAAARAKATISRAAPLRSAMSAR